MRRSSWLWLALFLAVPAVRGEARPLDPAQSLRFQALQPAEPHPTPALQGAGQGTVYFGGTYWNADSSRWEALRDSVWTFDSGVGSSFNHALPDVNPYKDPSLHATMEGWVGIDNGFSELTYFRRSTQCPAAAGYGLHCGVTMQEAYDLCYAAGAGYGNNWNVCMGHVFDYAGGAVTMTYTYYNETEDGWDFSRVIVDTVGAGNTADDVVAAEYTGYMTGSESLSLQPGETMPAGPRTGIIVKFCFTSDGGWSDEDGANPTVCGAFTVDNVALSGGISYPLQDFESGDGGWVLQPPPAGPGGDWSNIVHRNDLPAFGSEVVCGCGLQDSVLVFEDLTTAGHSEYQDNIAASPWIDLAAAGLVGAPGKVLEVQQYADLPLLNYILPVYNIQYWPDICNVDPSNPHPVTSGWIGPPVYYYSSPYPGCSTIRFEFGYRALQAERIRIGLGVLSYCRFFANCTGISNSTPWFDNVRLGVYGTGDAPVIATRTLDRPQDSFPADGTLALYSTGRIDCNNVQGASSPEPGTSLGDTLVVQGADDRVTGAEVWVQFAVRPGPGTDPGRFAGWLAKFGPSVDTSRGQTWYAARMDTAERAASGAVPGSWMTTWIEGNPNFSGNDTDLDPNDLDPNGRMTRLKNDMFPDDLLAAGSRLNLFYKTRYVGGSSWFTEPDTTGGNYLEMEVLPSSMDANGRFNCLLYVDHFDGRGAQPVIEQALKAVLPDGSPNWENTAWDRYDVRAPSSQQASFGRPAGTEYGATLVQALGYRTILWNSGNLDAFNLSKEDADVLNPWLTLSEFGRRNLYLSGDGLAKSMWNERASEPSAGRLLTDILGVAFTCGTMRDMDCPTGTPLDMTACVELDPVAGARTATRPLGGTQLGEGNGCPELRSFDVIQPSTAISMAVPQAEESYMGAAKTADYASVSSVIYDRWGGFTVVSRAVLDGISLHERRDPGACTYSTGSPPQAVQERLQEVLGWFAVTGGDTCMDVAGSVGLPDPGITPAYATRLLAASPNPLHLGTGTHLRFTLEREAAAKLAVYDLRGARVRVLLDGPGHAGENDVAWDGKDASGRPVAQGVYFYRLTALGKEFHRKLVVLGR